MILEVKQWPESQEVMDDPEWFWISDDLEDNAIVGASAYARVIDDSQFILVEKTTADEYNEPKRFKEEEEYESAKFWGELDKYEEAKSAHESGKYRYPTMHASVMEFECSKCKDIVPDSEYEDPYCSDCKMETIQEYDSIKEQIQEDLLCYFNNGALLTEKAKDEMCQIIVDNFKELEAEDV